LLGEFSSGGAYYRFITAREKRARRASIRISPQARLMVGYSGYTGYELCDSLQSNQRRLAGIDFVDKSFQHAHDHRGMAAIPSLR